MDKKQEKKVIETTQKLLDMLGIAAGVSLEATEDALNITLETEESGILIGYHGETLEALQFILALCIAKELGEFKRVSIEVGGYKKNRTDYLQQLVQQTKERVLSEQREVVLQNLKPWERRIVHMALSQDSDVESESMGEGRERVLIIRPKK